MAEISEPNRIEKNSFKIIRSELGEHHFTEEQLSILIRVIHTTADFDFKEILKFHPRAICSGIEALHKGASILTDVHMVEAGISNVFLEKLGVSKTCEIDHPFVMEDAKKLGLTRSLVSMRRNSKKIHNGIVVIGNAPTALLEVVRLVREECIRPALVVGVPVGFVNTAESKMALMALDIPYITCVGRKGGSPVAAAIINALMRLAVNENDKPIP